MAQRTRRRCALHMTRSACRRTAAILAAAVLASRAAAHDAIEDARELDAVEVRGHHGNAVGSSDASSQGTFDDRLILARPLAHPSAILESVPGLIVVRHSGDGKASQYFLRGFNLDHGTDFATSVAGTPVNLPTHAHGHGYTGLNFLIPELIDRVDYRKGPYFASSGDFSSAGSAAIRLRDRLEAPFAQATIGPHGHRRLLAAGSHAAPGGGTLLAAIEGGLADGPWDEPERMRKGNAVLRFSAGHRADGFDLTLMAYRSRWNATDQVPLRALRAGTVGRFGAIDPTDGGRTSRFSASTEWRRALGDGVVRGSAYALRYGLELFSNFTYALARPADGDQFLQRDARTVAGGSVARSWYGRLGAFPMVNELGLQVREDRIRVGLYDSVARRTMATVRDDRVRQTTAGVYGESGVQWTGWLRTVAGLRIDGFWREVDGALPANAGRSSDAIVSPKLSAVFGPWARTEFFANAGRGFHSNDARGTTTRVDPRTGDPVSPVTGVAGTRGGELGLRSELVPGLQTSLALWRLDVGSELVFVGDAGTTEAGRPSRRWGLEWSNRHLPRPWLALDADIALTRARFSDGAPEGPEIPGAPRRVIALSATARELGPWSATLRARHIGPRPLVEDGSVRSGSSTMLDARVGFLIGKGVDLTVDLFNLANRRVSDIEYYYASRLRGEPAAVTDVHLHPAEPRTIRATLRLLL